MRHNPAPITPNNPVTLRRVEVQTSYSALTVDAVSYAACNYMLLKTAPVAR